MARSRHLIGLLFPLVFAGLGGLGCQRDTQAPAVPAPVQGEAPAALAPAAAKVADVAALHQSFAEATVTEPPEEATRPPDKTAGGKVVGLLYQQIAGAQGKGGLWEQIRFATPEGQPVRYTAVIETDLGAIHVELWPEIAPNHVRNFIALAKVGYYEGLGFDRVLAEKVNDEPWDYLEAGCPLSTAEAGYGSIGYWLKPEISDKATHGAGTIGAWHGEALETAACKFYFTLAKAPWMDGSYTIFGKITQGLDVARAIHKRPVQPAPFNDRPVEPVHIRRVVIQSSAEPAPQVARGTDE